MIAESCDVLVIGSGPAGLSAALELLRLGGHRVVVMEKGETLHRRHCPVLSSGVCPTCGRCDLLCGVGGASGIVGGKLCFFPAGERLAKHTGYSTNHANREVMRYLDRIGFNLVRERFHEPIDGGYSRLEGQGSLKTYEALPLLTHEMRDLFESQMGRLTSAGATVLTKAEVIEVIEGFGADRFKVVFLHGGARREIAVRRSVILATGRSTARWLSSLLSQLMVKTQPSYVDIGVRIEVHRQGAAEILAELEDPKIKIHEGSKNETRTLCWCRGGELSITSIEGQCLIDGHFGDRRKPFTSVSLVGRIPVPTSSQPLDYALKHFRRPLGMVGPFHQDLQRFLGSSVNVSAAESAPPIPFRCAPLDISDALDRGVRDGIVELIALLDKLSGGKFLRLGAGRVYGPVVDNCWDEPDLDSKLMTRIPGLYVAGDITGLGRGIVQGLFSGLVVSQAVHNQAPSVLYELAQL